MINALTNEHHPCQALADVLTLRERFGDLNGLSSPSWATSTTSPRPWPRPPCSAGSSSSSAAPSGYELAVPGAVVVQDPAEAVRGAHAVYTDVFVSMGDEAEAAQRLRDLAPYQVNEALMELADPDAIFMHCLPAHRGEEVTAEVIDGPRSVVWQQAENRLPTEEAILYALIARTWELPRS